MNSDEQFYKKIGKSVIIELYNMNVIPPTNKKFKGHLLMAFFFEFYKID